MNYDIYNLDCSTFPCWVWKNGQLNSSSLSIPEGETTIWEALNALGYYSVCCYTGDGGFSSAILTYLYRFYSHSNQTLPDELYLAMTILDASGKEDSMSQEDWRRNADPGDTQVVEIVKLPDWSSVLDYVNRLIPIVTQAQVSNLNYG